MNIIEPAKETPVAIECDLCVIGGSCTGVFAAVRAARRGLKVCIIEGQGRFGGVASSSLVNVWHSTWDLKGEEQIVGGLTLEVVDRLKSQGQLVRHDPVESQFEFCFNPNELALILDDLIKSHSIVPFLHARLVATLREGRQITTAIIEDKSGRRAVIAKTFIDASGDADLFRRSHLETEKPPKLQPPTMAAIIDGLGPNAPDERKGHYKKLLGPEGPDALRNGFLWSADVPGCPNLKALFGTRVHGVDCANADDLTRAEMEARIQIGEILTHLRKWYGQDIGLSTLPSHIGVRDTRRILAQHRLIEMEVLEGQKFNDAIAHGTYRVDIHKQGGAGLIFRYLNGREVHLEGQEWTEGRWREERDIDPPFYSIPFRSLIPISLDNVLAAGRCLCTDDGAYGAVRVMVLCNQTGEAAGEAAAMFVSQNSKSYCELAPENIVQNLNEGGSKIQPHCS